MDFFNTFLHFFLLSSTYQHFPALFGTQPADATNPKPKKQPKTSPPPHTTNIVVLSNQQNPNQNPTPNLLINSTPEKRKK
jgi:hypothetical protein